MQKKNKIKLLQNYNLLGIKLVFIARVMYIC
jgi:hypothetical protein